jgi:hypothetical protein
MKNLIYKLKHKIKNKKIQLNQRKKINVYNTDVLGFSDGTGHNIT